ncbi:hypothetical protein CAAN1_01S07822 [[Candida] anglica]|uniref:Brl1/Brr6 domain-containing protein n=1 Tax=[Candida] anglica TaxID=148631 RepID=A0ABP0EMR0_9ASCO
MAFNRSTDYDGTFFSALSLNETTNETEYLTAANTSDHMDIDDEYDNETIHNFHTPEPEPESEQELEGAVSSTPFDWKVWANKDFASKKEVEKDEMKRDLEKILTHDDQTDFETCVEDEYEYDLANTSQSSISGISMSILSPTTLGAKFALEGSTRKQKLLMPAPPPEEDSLVDYEYDTASPPEQLGKIRNISGFSTNTTDPSLVFAPTIIDDKSEMKSFGSQYKSNIRSRADSLSEELIYNPATGEYDSQDDSYLYRKQKRGSISTTHGASIAQLNHRSKYPSVLNSPSLGNQSWTSAATPIQVHHHHYYSTPQTTRDMLIQSQTSNLSHMTPLEYSQKIQELTPMNRGSVQERLDVIHQDNNNGELGTLPQPWQSNSTPHERIPYILSSYIQLLLNFVATGYVGYLVFAMVRAVRTDISHKVSQHATDIMVRIAACEHEYIENHCDNVVPATAKYCANLQRCINQNPYEGGNMSSISAETVGMIINSLVEPLGLKFFLVLFGFVCILFACNFMFGFFRAKAYYGWNEDTDDGQRERVE